MPAAETKLHQPNIAVVGAGPAGVVTAAVLLQRGLSVNWVDERFKGAGGMSDWAEIPANTKVDVLERCLDGLPGQQEWSQQAQSHGLQAAIHGLGQPPGGWSLEVNADPSPKGWCNLRQLCYVIESLAAILCDRWGDKGGIGGLACHTGSAIRASYTSKDCKWSLTVSHGNGDTSLLRCDAVVIATGGTPRLPEDMTLPDKLGVRVLEQPTALVPSRLAQTVSAESSVAIVGNSHSAFIVAENLYNLGCRDVAMFGRRPLRFAVWDEERSIYTDNAFGGLKGRSAEFAMRHVLGMASPTKPSDANAASLGTFKPDGSEGEAPNGSEWLRCLHLSHLRSHLEEGRANTLVYALGFARRPLPDLSLDGHPVSVLPGFAGFDHGEGGCGQLMAVMPADLSAPETASGRIPMQGLPRAYGVGLAFPAVDPSNSSYEAASIPIFIQRAVAIANDILGQ